MNKVYYETKKASFPFKWIVPASFYIKIASKDKRKLQLLAIDYQKEQFNINHSFKDTPEPQQM